MKTTHVCVCLLFFTLLYITLGNNETQPSGVKTAKLGHSVTLSCSFKKDAVDWVYWIRQKIGEKPCVVVKANKHHSAKEFKYYNHKEFNEGFNETNHFNAYVSDKTFNLTISNTEHSDSALYYCAVVSHTKLSFGDVTFLMVTGENSSLSVRVTQQPAASVPAQPGDSVTLQCTVDSGSCAGEHSVYWFTLASGESQPGVIYSHGGRSAECEKSPEAGSVPQSCVYSLPVNHADTYYCAVAACGHMVLGNGTTVGDGGSGTKVEDGGNGTTVGDGGSGITVEDGCNSSGCFWTTLSLLSVLALSVVTNIVLLTINKAKRSSGVPTVGQQRVTEVDSHQQDPHSEDLLNYAAINLKKPKPQRKKREPKEDTLYFDLRYQH